MINLEQQKFLIDAQLQLKQLAELSGVQIDLQVRDGGFQLQFMKDEREARAEFELYSSRFGYNPNWFGKVFSQRGSEYRIVGVRPTAEKNCLKIRRVKDNKEFVCAPGFIPFTQQQELA
jgi:hypothetical protein